MRVLLDTNIFIYRENYKIIPLELQKLLRILNILKVELLIHPFSIKEIEKNSDVERREIVLSKVQIYSLLGEPPDPSQDQSFLGIVGVPSTINDYIDNALLYAVHKDAVDFLVSEDKGIHIKSLKLDLQNRVLSIEDALLLFQEKVYDTKISSPPAIKDTFIYNLDVNDPFFDSIKEEYFKFEKWFKKISREGRKCWVYFEEDGSIGALLIYKIENEAISSIPPLPKKERLKICTMKVIHTGYKIGELFIKLSVQFCINNNIEEIYLTCYSEKRPYLIQLITEYGFYKTAEKNTEDVYNKQLIPDKKKISIIATSDIAKKFYPSFYDGFRVKKFIIPIRPEYHERLFIEYNRRQTTLPEHIGEFIIEGNTIKKAYLSHSKITKMRKGDIILFYRSKDRKELTSLGIIERIYSNLTDPNKIFRLVARRTVYPLIEIKQIAKKPTLVILFQHHFHLQRPVKFKDLKLANVLKGAPQTISEISHEKYLKIKEMGGIDGRYTVN